MAQKQGGIPDGGQARDPSGETAGTPAGKPRLQRTILTTMMKWRSASCGRRGADLAARRQGRRDAVRGRAQARQDRAAAVQVDEPQAPAHAHPPHQRAHQPLLHDGPAARPLHVQGLPRRRHGHLPRRLGLPHARRQVPHDDRLHRRVHRPHCRPRAAPHPTPQCPPDGHLPGRHVPPHLRRSAPEGPQPGDHRRALRLRHRPACSTSGPSTWTSTRWSTPSATSPASS